MVPQNDAPPEPPERAVFLSTWPMWRLASVAIRRWVDWWRLGALHRPGQRRWRYRGALYRWFDRLTRVSGYPYHDLPMGHGDALRLIIQRWTVYYGVIDRLGCSHCGFVWIPPANDKAIDGVYSADSSQDRAVVHRRWCPRCARCELAFD